MCENRRKSATCLQMLFGILTLCIVHNISAEKRSCTKPVSCMHSVTNAQNSENNFYCFDASKCYVNNSQVFDSELCIHDQEDTVTNHENSVTSLVACSMENFPNIPIAQNAFSIRDNLGNNFEQLAVKYTYLLQSEFNKWMLVLNIGAYSGVLIGYATSPQTEEACRHFVVKKFDLKKPNEVTVEAYKDYAVSINAGLPFYVSDWGNNVTDLSSKIVMWGMSHAMRMPIMVQPKKGWTSKDYSIRVPSGIFGSWVGDTASRMCVEKLPVLNEGYYTVILVWIDFGVAAFVRELPRKITEHGFSKAVWHAVGQEISGDLLSATTFWEAGELLRGRNETTHKTVAVGLVGVMGYGVYEGVVNPITVIPNLVIMVIPIAEPILPVGVTDFIQENQHQLICGFNVVVGIATGNPVLSTIGALGMGDTFQQIPVDDGSIYVVYIVGPVTILGLYTGVVPVAVGLPMFVMVIQAGVNYGYNN